MNNIEKIKIAENQYVWVDKEAEIKGICLANGLTYKNFIAEYMESPCPPPYVSNKNILTKIIAATSNLNIQVPTWEEYLARNEYPEKIVVPMFDGAKEAHEFIYIGAKFVEEKRKAYIKGYQKRDEEAKEEMKEFKKQGMEYACLILESLLETGVNPKYNLSDILRCKMNLIDINQVRLNSKNNSQKQ